jgi:O-antigen/teichoic acid export membrane protein
MSEDPEASGPSELGGATVLTALGAETGSPPAAPPSGLRKPLQSFLRLASGQGVAQLIAFVVLALVARRVGPSNFGAYQFAFSALTYFYLLANLGVTTHAVRDVSSGSEPASTVAGEVLVIRLAMGLSAFALLALLAGDITPNHHTAVLLEVIGVALVFEAITGEWLLQAYERFTSIALAAFLRQATAGALALAILTDGFAGVERYSGATVAGSLLATAVMAAVAIRITGRPRITLSPARLLHRFRRSIPFSWSLMMVQVYYTTDFLILGYLKGTTAVGRYGVAYRVPTIVISVILVWGSAAYPYLASRAVSEPDALRQHVRRATSVALIIAAALVAITVPLAHGLIVEIFGRQYGAAGAAYAILTVNAAVVIASVDLANVLLVSGHERQYAQAVTSAAVVNTALNFILIPPFGIVGAAIATLCAELTVFVYICRVVRRNTGLALETTRLVRGAIAAALTCLGLTVVPHALPALGEAAIGVIAFGVLAIALRVTTLRELLPRGLAGA